MDSPSNIKEINNTNSWKTLSENIEGGYEVQPNPATTEEWQGNWILWEREREENESWPGGLGFIPRIQDGVIIWKSISKIHHIKKIKDKNHLSNAVKVTDKNHARLW